MGKIHVLDRAVADQIAAGEVVERPSSAVKELLENALDAGAQSVEIHIETRAGFRIRVVDDGCGMSAEDAVLAFSRHATSKLQVAEDLRRVGTFGFRGEALAALASVARVQLRTREPTGEAGTEVCVEGGHVLRVQEVGTPRGTSVDVDDLFFNVPARRKFLKGDRTEIGHIEAVVVDAALALPQRGFRLFIDGRVVVDLPPVLHDDLAHPQRLERLARCLGKHVRPHLFPLHARTDLLELRGHLVAPLETRRDLGGVHLSVNGRPVADRALVSAVRAAYRTLLEVGRQPIAALDIEIDKDLVDVNVHPRKAEVRFVDARRVNGHLIAAISELLASTPWLRAQPAGSGPRRFILKDGGAGDAALPSSAAMFDIYRHRIAGASTAERTPASATAATGHAAVADAIPAGPSAARDELAHTFLAGATHFSALRAVGQVGGTYLVLEGPLGMVVVDQHAAHERVVFERLRAARRLANAPSQPLLIPLQLDVDGVEIAALHDPEAVAVLARHGIGLELFGERVALLRAMPPGLDVAKAEQIARDALIELGRGGAALSLAEREDAICARLACHAAVRKGDLLAPESINALLRELDAIDLGAHCPHGRPVSRTVPFFELAEWFDRT